MFEDQLLFSMKDLMNSILQGQSMFDSWKDANIALMLKEGQDLTFTIYYSLLNDYKLFTSILAERLKMFYKMMSMKIISVIYYLKDN